MWERKLVLLLLDNAGDRTQVELLLPATFNGYMDLKFFLEYLLGLPVDLFTRKSIRPRTK